MEAARRILSPRAPNMDSAGRSRGSALRFHEIQFTAKLARFLAGTLLLRSQVAELRIERLHLVLEIANQIGERADFRGRFRRFGRRGLDEAALRISCPCSRSRAQE